MAELETKQTLRLDQKVAALLPDLSRAFGAKLIEQGRVQVNGNPVVKRGYKLRPTDEVFVDFDPAAAPTPQTPELPILYEDEDCVVINKPLGMLTHSKGAFNAEPTVATWLSTRVSGLSGERAGVVHRLDRATSGVMICAKTPGALHWLQRQFSERKVKKTYFALVVGSMPHEHALIDMPIERNPKHPQTFRVGSRGKVAQTEYWVRRQLNDVTLLELQPKTGRTHQLRVHLGALHRPILGDTVYGGRPADRLYLHAYQLEITLPNRTRRLFVAQLPAAFRAIIET